MLVMHVIFSYSQSRRRIARIGLYFFTHKLYTDAISKARAVRSEPFVFTTEEYMNLYKEKMNIFTASRIFYERCMDAVHINTLVLKWIRTQGGIKDASGC